MTIRLNKQRLFADIGYEPHQGQLTIHMATELRRIVACGVRWGKTKAAAMEALAAALQPAEYSVGWIVAPNYDLANRVFREIVLTVRNHLRHHIIAISESQGTLKLRNMQGGISEIQTKSAESPDSLLGEGLDWLVIDEASRIKASIWFGYLAPRLTDKSGWALMISTPKGKGFFCEMFRLGQSGDQTWRSWNLPSWTNPRLPVANIEEARAKSPEKVFRQEYGAEFIEGEGAVFRNVRECATGAFRDWEPGRKYYAGLDLARTEDFTVLSIVDDKKRLVFVDRYRRLDWSIQLQRVKVALQRYRNPPVYVDSTGAGQPVFELLRKEGVQAIGYTFSRQSKDALINNLALMLEKMEVGLPRPDLWSEGIEELEEFQYSITDAGNLTSAAPGGGHDDIVISLALAAWHLRPRQEPTISLVPAMVLVGDAIRQDM